MKTGQIFLGNIVCAFVMKEESVHSMELVVNSRKMYDDIVNFFKSEDKNKDKIIPYIVGRMNDNRYFLFFDCMLKVSSFNFITTDMFMSFDKCIYTENNVDINMDVVNLKINDMQLKGENIIKFIGYEYFKKLEEVLKIGNTFDILYNDKVLNVCCSIDKNVVVHYMDPNTFELKETKDNPYISLKILNSKNITDYFYLLTILDKVLKFCFQKESSIIQNVSFEYEGYKANNHKYFFFMIKDKINTLSGNAYNLKLDYLSLEIFCKLIQKFNKKDNDKNLNLRFLSCIDKINDSFFEDLYSNFITIAQTFENEFNLKYPDFNDNREIKDVLINILENIDTFLSDEQIDFLSKVELMPKNVKVFSKRLIPFLVLKKGTLSEKIKEMFLINSDFLTENFRKYSGFDSENIKTFTKNCDHFADVRNKISHGRSYEVKCEKSDFYIYFSLIAFIYYFYLHDLGIDSNKLINYFRFFDELGYVTDGFEVIEIDKWLEDYAPLLKEVINII